MAEPLEAGLVARIWPPDCFPDAHPPDRLTVQGRGAIRAKRDRQRPPERSDPLTVRPEGVGGGRLLKMARAQRGPTDEERQRRITNERSEFQ
jgi:hypothetical protein